MVKGITKNIEFTALVAGLISIGALANEVNNIKDDTNKKVDQVVVDTQYQALQSQLVRNETNTQESLNRIYKILKYQFSEHTHNL